MTAGDEEITAETVPEGIKDVVGLALGALQAHAVCAERKQGGAGLAGLVVVYEVTTNAGGAGELVGTGLAEEEGGIAAETGKVESQVITLDAGLTGEWTCG